MLLQVIPLSSDLHRPIYLDVIIVEKSGLNIGLVIIKLFFQYTSINIRAESVGKGMS
jgi:hypothetical protein